MSINFVAGDKVKCRAYRFGQDWAKEQYGRKWKTAWVEGVVIGSGDKGGHVKVSYDGDHHDSLPSHLTLVEAAPRGGGSMEGRANRLPRPAGAPRDAGQRCGHVPQAFQLPDIAWEECPPITVDARRQGREEPQCKMREPKIATEAGWFRFCMPSGLVWSLMTHTNQKIDNHYSPFSVDETWLYIA